ncbi:MAG: S-adenosylmethionine:tRNA ribosyltransferase-isomerase [Bacteroidetes bacterium]|nr:MAG: S-adenosylmethionine:tRNA ribosyltransferase-isomerase [Bacteroidota bacterium]
MNKNVQEIQIKDYTYDLPEHKIAKYPLQERDLSKLLIYHNGLIEETVYKNIDVFIPEKSFLIFNNTKVIQARLNFKNLNGAGIEIFCLEPGSLNPEYTSAMNQKGSVEWKCFVGRLVKWKEKIISKDAQDFKLNAEIVGESAGTFTIKFSWQPENYTFAEVLEQAGEMPIPPYLKRESEGIDKSRYQTVYASQDGSVAAPTAGLHFTERIFEKLNSKLIKTDFVTLHVGAGTFKPVKTDTIADHEMHYEWIEVGQTLIEKLLVISSDPCSDQKIITVGTTSLRTIETLYWMGVKASLKTNSELSDLEVKQWDAYELPQDIELLDSLNALLSWLKKNEIRQLFCKTQILIAPPYRLRIAQALITNFHQPNSTLLLLVAAVVGPDWKKIYDYALDHNLRFLSYGDGSLLFSRTS